MNQSELEAKRASIACEMNLTIKKVEHAKSVLAILSDRLSKQRVEYELVDRELAMLDGRYTKITRCKRTQKEPELKLTKEQVLALIDMLNAQEKGE
jgi:hypothetical protein